MNEVKFQVSPVVGTIAANFDEVAKEFEERMSQYDGIVFTEDKKADAKKVVADLRKDKKEITDSFKAVKELWMAPLNQFKQNVDELAAKADKPINHINGQIEAFEAKRLEERRAEIQAIYDEEIGDMEDFLPLYRIQDEKWLNASRSLKSIRKELSETVVNARAGKLAIEAMQSDTVSEALRKFQSSLNLPEALAHINAYEAQKADMLRREEDRRRQEEERKHRAEIERIREEERQRVADEERIRQEAKKQAMEEVRTVDNESAAPLAMPESLTAVYTVVGTEEELRDLEMAMISLGLYYERKDV